MIDRFTILKALYPISQPVRSKEKNFKSRFNNSALLMQCPNFMLAVIFVENFFLPVKMSLLALLLLRPVTFQYQSLLCYILLFLFLLCFLLSLSSCSRILIRTCRKPLNLFWIYVSKINNTFRTIQLFHYLNYKNCLLRLGFWNFFILITT